MQVLGVAKDATQVGANLPHLHCCTVCTTPTAMQWPCRDADLLVIACSCCTVACSSTAAAFSNRLTKTRHLLQADIRKAYYRLALQLHPDKNPDKVGLRGWSLVQPAFLGSRKQHLLEHPGLSFDNVLDTTPCHSASCHSIARQPHQHPFTLPYPTPQEAHVKFQALQRIYAVLGDNSK